MASLTASIALGNLLLSYVWLLGVSDALDGDDMFAIDAGQRGQAGVDAGMVDLLGGRVPGCDNDGAGAATALSTASVRLWDVLSCQRDDKRMGRE